MRRKAHGEYYKASGICSGFDLLALFFAEFIAVSVLSLPYIVLSCYLEKGFGKIFSIVFLPLLTAWLCGWLAMVFVKHFKIRAAFLAAGTVFFAAALGWFGAWVGGWLLAQSDLPFFQFISTANSTLQGATSQHGHLMILIACCFPIIAMPISQASHPFNEASARWFKRKTLKPFRVKNSFYDEFLEVMCGDGDFYQFFNGQGYKLASNAGYIANMTLSRVAKIWLCYDRDFDTCYITVRESLPGALDPRFYILIRNKAITRNQAKLLYQKLA